MARMIPDTIPDAAPPSEKTIFNNLMRSSHSGEWTVFHSEYVKNPKHPARPREIDFLIFMPEYCSIVCLEAKGGSFTRDKGRWYRYSPPHREPVEPSPPNQARGAMFAFEDEHKTSYFQRGSLLSLGCAVAFTDAEFTEDETRLFGAEIIEKCDARDPHRLGRWLADYAAALPTTDVKRQLDSSRQNWLGALEAIDNLQLELEASVLITTRPERIVRRDLETLGEQLLRLTTDQFNSLKRIQLPRNRRCVIDGAAGTGKTVLAMELARRLCENGETAAMLCSNPYLSSRFQRWTKTLPKDNGGSVVAGTPATLPLEALSEHKELQQKLQKRLDDSPELAESPKPGALHNEWGEFIEETIQDLGKGGDSFDYLIVDEAQNLCDDVFLELMDALLKGGLKDGRWTMFGDFTYQDIVLPQLNIDRNEDKKDGIEFLESKGLTFSEDLLETNCRNTYEIAAAVAMFVDIESPSRSGVHGPLVQIEYFESEEELVKLLERLVSSLREREILSRQIILLANDNDDFGNAKQIAGWKLQNIRDAEGDKPLDSKKVLPVSGDSSPKTLRYSDIYDFQGLESEVVILVMPLTEKQSEVGGGAILPNYEHLRRVLYTGMSRAKAMLIIVAHKTYEEHLELTPEFEPTYEEHIDLLRVERNR